MNRIFNTHGPYPYSIRRWRECTMEQWDKLPEGRRDILLLRNGEGIVFVELSD
jgi:hypothetical protein